jgi:hypothetical protein
MLVEAGIALANSFTRSFFRANSHVRSSFITAIPSKLTAWFWLPHGLHTAWFLNAKGWDFAAKRILRDNSSYNSHTYGGDADENSGLSERDVKETLRDWKLWYVLVSNICAGVPSQTFSVFLPLVVQGLGYSPRRRIRYVYRSSCIVAIRMTHRYAGQTTKSKFSSEVGHNGSSRQAELHL